MQTFLPYSDFSLSAECLDYKRLGKQRVETMQIMNTLCGLSSGWSNHPAVKMWEDYEYYLYLYQEAIVAEWVKRGYKDNVCLDKTIKALENCQNLNIQRPPWLGEPKLHASHRSNLLRKDFDYYSRFSWEEDSTMEYWWPSQHLETKIGY